MRKTHPDGAVKEYPHEDLRGDWTVNVPPSTEPNLTCDCGSDEFKVCWWDYPYTGGYCRVVCAGCGVELVLIDDYA